MRTLTLALTCLTCNKLQPDIKVDPEDFRDWEQGKMIQQAMPYLTLSEREMLISQTCDSCWEKMFGEEGED